MNMLIRRDEHSIDKKFRQHLYDAEESTPLHLWDDVRAKSRRRKRPIIWWFVSAAAVSVASVCSILWLQSGTDEKQSRVIAQRMEMVNSVEIEDDQMKSNAPDDVHAPSSLAGKAVNTINDETLSPRDHNRVTFFKENASSSEKKAKRSDNTKNVDLKDTYDQIQVKNTPVSSAQDNEPWFDMADPNSSMHEELANEPSRLHTSLESEILDASSLPMHTTASMTLPVIKPSRLSVGAYYAVSAPRRVAANGSSERELNHLQSRTKFGRANSYGMVLSYALYKEMYLSAGIETASFKESHTSFDSTRTYQVVFNENQVATYNDGSTVPVYVTVIDSTEHETINVLKSRQTNSYSSVNVPLLLGVTIPVSKRLSIMADAGPVLRIERSVIGSLVFANGIQSPAVTNIASADVLHSNMDYVYLNEYYANWKTDMHVGLFMSANLWKGWSVNAGAQCRWMLEKTDNIKSLSHRMVQPGIRAGVACRI